MSRQFSIYILLIMCVAALAHDARAENVVALTWAPPIQNAPNTYSIQKQADGVSVQKNDDQPTLQDAKSHIEIKLGRSEDAIIVLPNDVLIIPSLRIHHGRHIRIVGGHLKASIPANKTVRGLIWAGGTRGSVYIEGVVLDTNFQNGIDALLVGGYGDQPAETYPDIYVQNVVMKNIMSKDGNVFHADCFQYYGPTNATYVDRADCKTDTQGFFIAPQNHIGSIDLRHVSIDYTNPEKANGYALYLRDKPEDQHVPISLQDVYVGRRDTNFGYGHDGKWEVYSIFPHALLDYGSERVEDQITFPHNPEIQGFVSLKTDQNFVLNAGAGYQSVYPYENNMQ